MNILSQLQKSFAQYILDTFSTDITNISSAFVLNTDENKQQFGDISSNIAMIVAKQEKKAFRQVAQQVIDQFSHVAIKKMEIAGPGFINIHLSIETFATLAMQIYAQKNAFFKSEISSPKKINIEFVSANPTGPLHFGHGRGAIIGDVLGNILSFLGYDTTKEFYINDAGAQVEKLGMSLKIRSLQIAGHDAELPEDAYHGEYIIDLAQDCFAQHGHDLLNKDDIFFADYAKNQMLINIQETLKEYGVHFDTWFSEKTLHEHGAVERALSVLQNNGFLYEAEGATWFASTQFGDDKDRVVRRGSGQVTYIAADVAYLQNKADREFHSLIMILGHDHHSYATRLETCRQALKLSNVSLDVLLYQLVKITEEGQLVRMSKRAGTFVTLQDIINTVGKDVARFFYLHRKADAQLEFDLQLALKKTDENPVYYAQYAYVRMGSILQRATAHTALQNICENDAQYINTQEQLLLKKIAALSNIMLDIANNFHTHLLTYYLLELATLFHHYYAHHKIVDETDISTSRGRLFVLMNVRNTFELVLDLIGVCKIEKM